MQGGNEAGKRAEVVADVVLPYKAKVPNQVLFFSLCGDAKLDHLARGSACTLPGVALLPLAAPSLHPVGHAEDMRSFITIILPILAPMCFCCLAMSSLFQAPR